MSYSTFRKPNSSLFPVYLFKTFLVFAVLICGVLFSSRTVYAAKDKTPPVRSTIAVAKGGVPGDSLVEMDCIAYI